MRTMLLIPCVAMLAVVGFSQSFSLIQNNEITNKTGICIGYDPANQKVIRSSFGNPPVIDVLHKDTLAIEGSLATGGVTWGTLGGFGMGVGPEGSIVCLDHQESPAPYNGLVRWSNYTDASPGLCTAPSSIPFPRYLTILGTGTDQVFVCAGSGNGGPLNVLTTADGNTWSIAYSVPEPTPTATPTPTTTPPPGGQRGSAAYVASGTNEFPELLFGCDRGISNGIHVYRRIGGDYEFQGNMNPTSPDSAVPTLSIAVDPGIEPQVGVEGEAPVLISLGWHDAVAEGSTALYMFDLRTFTEVTKLVFSPAAGEIDQYGAIDLDTENNRVYFSIRSSTAPSNSTLGYANYTVPSVAALPSPTPPLAASGWHRYE